MKPELKEVAKKKGWVDVQQIYKHRCNKYPGLMMNLVKGHGNLAAYCRFTYGHIVVSGAKLISGSNGLYLCMPSRRTPYGQWEDIVYFNDINTKEEIQNRLIEFYEAINDPCFNPELESEWHMKIPEKKEDGDGPDNEKTGLHGCDGEAPCKPARKPKR